MSTPSPSGPGPRHEIGEDGASPHHAPRSDEAGVDRSPTEQQPRTTNDTSMYEGRREEHKDHHAGE
jgi:hypothetical protein